MFVAIFIIIVKIHFFCIYINIQKNISQIFTYLITNLICWGIAPCDGRLLYTHLYLSYYFLIGFVEHLLCILIFHGSSPLKRLETTLPTPSCPFLCFQAIMVAIAAFFVYCNSPLLLSPSWSSFFTISLVIHLSRFCNLSFNSPQHFPLVPRCVPSPPSPIGPSPLDHMLESNAKVRWQQIDAGLNDGLGSPQLARRRRLRFVHPSTPLRCWWSYVNKLHAK